MFKSIVDPSLTQPVITMINNQFAYTPNLWFNHVCLSLLAYALPIVTLQVPFQQLHVGGWIHGLSKTLRK